jgi:hypothetical protein
MSVAPGCASTETPPAAPSTPIQVELSISEAPPLNTPALLTCTVSTTSDALDTTAQITLPDGATLVSGTLDWQGDLRVGEPVSFSAEIVFVETGNWRIEASARHVVDENNSWGDLEAIFLTIGVDHSEFGWPPTGPVEIEQEDAPVLIDFSISHPPLLNELAELTLTLSPRDDMPDITARIMLPEGAALVDGSLEWHGDLQAGVPVTLSAQIVFKETGNWSIKGGYWQWVGEENSWGVVDFIYLIIGIDHSEFGQPPEPDIDDLPSPPSI